MGRDMPAGVQTGRNRTVGVCEIGEHEERGSGKYELKSRADELRMNPRRGMNRGAKRAQPVTTRTPHIAGQSS